ncbi:uncharacterized protein Z518_10040 [Rhinocladiella mackenziei CBS 650.93]|uniref:Uncharacterized protein n=1 Tax=Rhinocladiella mackenziei CBS 650.93 TaxID=1442369 RepID=A0A0D2I590_9EURO|nr:uncharacterized protein Z518_10040 [Rhinocladiella mackenziei CBS 650.93]KIX00974.1 hypothetical protein Z518_10040 [Rhinocladiella mackenziei CBS 650.93]
MAESTSSALLPAFGVRDLNGSKAPPGIVQITGGQYDTTIRSQPDAVLSYIDDDDGDVITVGSSFELEQRLDEPARHSVLPVSPAFPTGRESKENKMMMHIFDIKHTSGSLAVWREHEAYTTKSLGRQDSPRSSRDAAVQHGSALHTKPSLTQNATIPSQPNAATNRRPQTASDKASTGVSSESKSEIPTYERDISTQLDKALTGVFNGLEPHLVPIADFLETTAEGLRKVAEKTAEQDNTPAEVVLSGFKNILAEVGEMGLEFLAALDEEYQQDKAQKISTASKPAPQPVTQQGPVETATKRVSFVEIPPPPVEKKPEPLKDLDHNDRKVFGTNTSLYAHRSQQPILADPPFRTKPQPPVFPRDIQRASQLDPSKSSILDQEPSDPDFSTRYPPLLSLRKAKSVSGLHDKSQNPDVSQRPSMNTSSALSRYPSIAQLNEQIRFPSKSKPTPKPTTVGNGSMNAGIPVGTSKPVTTNSYKKPGVEDDVNTETSPKEGMKPEAGPGEDSPVFPTWLPGAWPEQRTKDSTTVLPTTEASGIQTLTKAPRNSVAPPREHLADGLSHRISSPFSDTYSRETPPPHFPKRHQTVTGINPAARLNGPFNPLDSLSRLSSLQPRHQKSQPNLSRVNTNSETLTKEPPVVFPQRSRTVNYTDRYRPVAFNYPRPNSFDSHLKDGLGRPTASLRSSAESTPTTSSHSENTIVPKITTRPQDIHHPRSQRMFPQPPAAGQRPQSSVFSPPPPASLQSRHPRPMKSEPYLPRMTSTNTTSSSTSLYPPAPAPIVAEPPANMSPTFTLSPITSPRGRSGIPPPPPTASSRVDDCVKILKGMGYGTSDANEMSRLNVYAGATAGNVEDAIEMIEEDREAARELAKHKDVGERARIGPPGDSVCLSVDHLGQVDME